MYFLFVQRPAGYEVGYRFTSAKELQAEAARLRTEGAFEFYCALPQSRIVLGGREIETGTPIEIETRTGVWRRAIFEKAIVSDRDRQTHLVASGEVVHAARARGAADRSA